MRWGRQMSLGILEVIRDGIPKGISHGRLVRPKPTLRISTPSQREERSAKGGCASPTILRIKDTMVVRYLTIMYLAMCPSMLLGDASQSIGLMRFGYDPRYITE